MNMENNQARFNHEDWLSHLSRYMETAREFCNELIKGVKTLSQKGFLEAWSEIRFAASKLTPQDIFVTGLIGFIGILGGLVFMIGLSLFGYQAVLWLQNGIWTEFPLFTVFNFIFENTSLHQWMVQPESWIGLQKLFLWFLESIPLSLALMVPGFTLSAFMVGALAITMIFRFNQLRKKHD